MQHTVEIDYQFLSTSDAEKMLQYLETLEVFEVQELIPPIPHQLEALHSAVLAELRHRFGDHAFYMRQMATKIADIAHRRMAKHPGHDEEIRLSPDTDWRKALDAMVREGISHSFGLRAFAELEGEVEPCLYFPLNVDKAKVYRILEASGIRPENPLMPAGHVIHVPLTQEHETAVNRHLMKAGVSYVRRADRDIDRRMAYEVHPSNQGAANLALIGAFAESLREGNIQVP